MILFRNIHSGSLHRIHRLSTALCLLFQVGKPVADTRLLPKYSGSLIDGLTITYQFFTGSHCIPTQNPLGIFICLPVPCNSLHRIFLITYANQSQKFCLVTMKIRRIIFQFKDRFSQPVPLKTIFVEGHREGEILLPAFFTKFLSGNFVNSLHLLPCGIIGYRNRYPGRNHIFPLYRLIDHLLSNWNLMGRYICFFQNGIL